jgi:hypothetical protein
MFSFRLQQNAQRPILNDFFYSTNTSLAYSNTLNNKVALHNMALIYPERLIETYYECYPTIGSAFTTAVGLAKGNADLFVAVGSMIVINFVLYYVYFSKRVKLRSRIENDKIEKDAIYTALIRSAKAQKLLLESMKLSSLSAANISECNELIAGLENDLQVFTAYAHTDGMVVPAIEVFEGNDICRNKVVIADVDHEAADIDYRNAEEAR